MIEEAFLLNFRNDPPRVFDEMLATGHDYLAWGGSSDDRAVALLGKNARPASAGLFPLSPDPLCAFILQILPQRARRVTSKGRIIPP